MSKFRSLSRAVGEALSAAQQVLAVAESCTGGGVAYALTAVSGSSVYFDRGFVTYSNDAKHCLLGVSRDCLDQHGAVSEPTALAMAEGALQNSQATVSLSVTGIAGPAGGRAEKPVGFVCFGFAANGKASLTVAKQFSGDRQAVREQSILFALEALIAFLAGKS